MSSFVRGALPTIRWSAIFSGALCAIAIHIVMGLFGTAMGFAAAPTGAEALGGLAVFWAILTPLVATFIGAYVAVRASGTTDKASDTLHGVLVWCLGLIAGAMFLTAMLAGTAAGAAQLGAEGARGARAATGAAAGSGLAGLAALFGLGGAFIGAAAGRKSLRQAYEAERPEAVRSYREEEIRPTSTSVSKPPEGPGVPPYGH